MRRFRKPYHPLLTFIGIQMVWGLLVFFWIYWFFGKNREFRALAEQYKPDLLAHGHDWLFLAGGLVLLFIILAGVYIIFLYGNWQSNLYKRQRSYISQLTHELKSPLASIQLHLETIRLRDLPRQRLEYFLDTMLADTDRLHNLINNLLLTAKLEQRRSPVDYPVVDFSAFLSRFLEESRRRLPDGGTLTWEVEEGIACACGVEEMEMVLRNLFENALLYSIDAPEIAVTLHREGRRCRLVFSDRGKGMEPADMKKIFQMFYRIRRPGESIRGTGLGLYIVRSVVQDHGGTVQVASDGPGTGCAFTISLPLAGPKEERS